jgi:NTE family protein
VLGRLFDEEWLSIDGITATSFGAVNAVALAYGLSTGGRKAAKDFLQLFWKRKSTVPSFHV